MPKASDSDDRTSGTVQSVMRALDVLEAVAQGGRSSSLSDICGETGLPGPTAFRLLNTLAVRGYVIKTAQREYSVGPAFVVYNSIAGDSLGSVADALLAGLVQRTAETAALVMRDRHAGIVVAHRSATGGQLFDGVGNGFPLHATAPGKCILAAMEPRKLGQYLKSVKLTRFTDRTITTVAALRAEIDQTRRSGFALVREELDRGVWSIAIPIPGMRDFSLSISGHPIRFTEDFCQTVAIPALEETARLLGPELEAQLPRNAWRLPPPVEAQAMGIGI